MKPIADLLRRAVGTKGTTMAQSVVRTVSCYNMLLPFYAVKWQEHEGITADGKSNWPTRKTDITRLLTESWSDVFLLQEVGKQELSDLHTGELQQWYGALYEPHPWRKDGLAILFKHNKYEIRSHTVLHHGNSGMVTLAAVLLDKDTQQESVFASVHVDWNDVPGRAQLEEIRRWVVQTAGQDGAHCRLVLGGDWNRTFEHDSAPPATWGPLKVARMYSYKTRGDNKIDWIFYTPGTGEEVQHRWADNTARLAQAATCSDHRLCCAAFATTAAL
eukprot:TRINITY_DN818_c0_g1_i1.p2 TRINITY_DN818_c0_g1~~TRINITY_DN818_c0_g1_i1.p2  ORF type:complete len:274 (+),score=54.71 TRINITY_DN818_c0_g1_i1:959-1780(+)